MIVSLQRGCRAGIVATGAFFAVAVCAPALAETTLIVGKANSTSDAIIPVNIGDERH